MTHIVLRSGAEWRLSKDEIVLAQRFRYLAKQYDSRAVWLPKSGVLVTHDMLELEKDYPYEQWLQMALYEGPGTVQQEQANNSKWNRW